ncbi:pentapeptide repeat-containing protein [Rhodococcoides fascians]|uniref:pentapeptide repeat-containing protein n=1 Tax=Rhodococcoides fascians TaxID=1828 RepID=UPI0018AF54BC|nr:pentapeptide repeat-containing protein [Rhodococcus fascians]
MSADFTHTCLVGVDLSGTDLQGADFSGSTISEVDFTGADLTGAQFSYATSYSYDSSGERFDLPIYSSAKLDSIDFTSSSGYKFYNAFIRGSTFRNSNFDRVDFSVHANSMGVIVPYNPLVNEEALISSKLFAEADLSGASFVGANFAGADLSAAYNIDGAILEGVYYNESTVWPSGFQPPKSADCYLVTQYTCSVYK